MFYGHSEKEASSYLRARRHRINDCMGTPEWSLLKVSAEAGHFGFLLSNPGSLDFSRWKSPFISMSPAL